MRLGGSGALRFHLGHAFLELTGEVGNDAELAFDEHKLGAVMHFVFFGTQQAFEAGLLCLAVGLGDVFRKEFRGQSLQPSSELVAFRAEELNDFGFAAGLVFFGVELVHEAEEVEADQGLQFLAVNLFPNATGDGDVGEHFADRPDLRRSHEVIFGFGNIFGNLDGVFADGAERIGQLFTAISDHESPRFDECAPGRRAASSMR